MPEYLAPGVYVEETSFRSRSIEGVSTTTTGFIGPTRYGPPGVASDILTSLAEFERVYGDGQPLVWDGAPHTNYMWHAMRAFFENGGRRAYVVRTWCVPEDAAQPGTVGVATYQSASAGTAIRARFPGEAGNLRVRFQLRVGKDARVLKDGEIQLAGLSEGDTVLRVLSKTDVVVCVAGRGEADARGVKPWMLTRLDDRTPEPMPTAWSVDVGVYPLRVTVGVYSASGLSLVVKDGCNPLDLPALFAERPARRADELTLPIIIDRISIADLNGPGGTPLEPKLVEMRLGDGHDSLMPSSPEYEGRGSAEAEDITAKTGLYAFEDLEDISIVAAPGSTELASAEAAQTINGLLLSHCDRMRYRIAVLDSPKGATIAEVRRWRARFDSTRGALYYPWVQITDPITRKEIAVPPSGFIAGIYARNDNLRAVWKAPANEVVQLAIGFETTLNTAQQEVLNPEGINCLRFFEGRGLRVWGARTLSSDPEWKYVNVRRYFAYLERSIDRGTQWAVFEPNGPALWNNIRRTIEDFLMNEYQSGALLGDRPEKAYFVKCDRSTMSQNDLDNGRLICQIGVAPLKPAEFVIFRIGQWTADARN